jgi:cytochrome oxidase Cu insertion factor (SCO1/SenC/PrrC family)
MQDSRARGRRTLLIVAAMFPAAGSRWHSRFTTQVVAPGDFREQGASSSIRRVPLAVAGLRHADGTPADASVLTGKWTLLYIGDGRCDEACRTALVFGASRASRSTTK